MVILSYYCLCCFCCCCTELGVPVCLVSHVRGTWTEGAEEDIWTREGGCKTRHWRTLLNKELHDYCSAIRIIRAMKYRRMRCVMPGGGKQRCIQGFGGDA